MTHDQPPCLVTYPGAERDGQTDKLKNASTTYAKRPRHISLEDIEDTETPWNQLTNQITSTTKDKHILTQNASSTNVKRPRHLPPEDIEYTETPWNQLTNQITPTTKDNSSSTQNASSTNVKKPRHISLEDIEDTDAPLNQLTNQITPTIIKENMLKHKAAILASMNLEKLYGLLVRYDMDDDGHYRSKREKAEVLFETVVKNDAFSEFLKALERGKEHMGHRYIASLLQGTPFGAQEDIDKSKMLLAQIKKHADDAMEYLNVDALKEYLLSAELLTDEESQDFTNNCNNTYAKARRLLAILGTKGPTAHSIFVYKCLAEEREHMAHAELYKTLTGEDVEYRRRLNRKRSAPPEDICTQPTKRFPHLLETPNGLKQDKYLTQIRTIRSYHQKGGDWWEIAEKIYRSVMNSEDSALEMKIAVLLESCTMYITKKDRQEVLGRVELAMHMSKRLHRNDTDVDMLEARCEWVKAKLYRYTKELDKAEERIAVARSKIHNCEEGEERALVSYCYACILLGKPDRTPQDEARAIEDLYIAIRCARQGQSEALKQGKYGLDPTHCKLRLVQARVGSSTGSTGKAVGEVPDGHIVEAMRILESIKLDDLQHRQTCMYLYTRSDVLRVSGKTEEAAQCAHEAFELARKHDFKTEIESAKLRQERLK